MSRTQGILICGSGIGMSIAANKISGIRAALVENPIAAAAFQRHNNANVLCLGSRFLATEYGSEITRAFLETPFSGDERHTPSEFKKSPHLKGPLHENIRHSMTFFAT